MLLASLSRAQIVPASQLLCVVRSFTGGNTTLTWTASPNNPCGSFYGYLVYSATNRNGPYIIDTTIGDQSATTWVQQNTGTGNVFYYIVDSFNCPGATYQHSDTIENESNPQIPIIQSVSVNADGSITVTWLPSASPQTKFYYVYIIPPSGQPIHDTTLAGRFNTTFRDTAHDPTRTSIEYTVAATDSCFGNQPSAYNTHPQRTIYLTYQAARCDRAIKLNWTEYVNMPGGILGYRVYISKNDSAYQMVAATDSGVLNYDYPDFFDGDSLQIFVAAVSRADTTNRPTSNYSRFIATVVKPPSFIYLTRLSVDTSNNAVDATWIVDNRAKIMSYEIYRSEDNVAYASIGVQNTGPPVPRFSHWADSTVTPQYGTYYYKVSGIDSCQTSTLSSYGNIISVNATLSDYYQVTVNWNLFHLDSAHVLRYNLYRGHGTGYQLIGTFDSTVTTYIDSVFQYLNEPGEFCYFIKADYHITLPLAAYSADTTTFSNIACVDHRPIIYIPNAFVYNGVNNFFKPRIIFGSPTAYSMSIFDRYGGKIFETQDPNGSWDGTNNGRVVDQGGYAYLIKFTALDGTPVERKGIVIFIRK